MINNSFTDSYLLIPPLTSDRINKTINMKNSILAIPAEAPAIPPNPRTPAIIAIIMNVTVQRNIIFGF
jgi:hypothetical protein